MDNKMMKLKEAKTKMDLIQIACDLNNHERHIHSDKVTFMGFLDFQESYNHVLKMIQDIEKFETKNK